MLLLSASGSAVLKGLILIIRFGIECTDTDIHTNHSKNSWSDLTRILFQNYSEMGQTDTYYKYKSLCNQFQGQPDTENSPPDPEICLVLMDLEQPHVIAFSGFTRFVLHSFNPRSITYVAPYIFIKLFYRGGL